MQESGGDTITEAREKRSRSDKIGRHKWNQQLLKRALEELHEIKLMQRTIFKGLEGMFHFDKPFIQKVSCRDEVDAWILELLYQNQPDGLFPKDVALRLRQYKLTRFHVLRRIKAMNKRLEREIGQRVAEKRGHHWALTSFAVDAWGETDGI